MTQTPGTPATVARPDADPCPRVEITVEPGDDNHTVSLVRWDSAGRTLVRGADRAPVSGTLLAVDFEAPLGEPITYTAVGFDVAGNPSETSGASVPVTLPGDGGCPWVHDPLAPYGATRWQVTDWRVREHERAGSVLWPIVSDVAVMLTGPRQRAASTMEVLTRDEGQARALLILSDAPTVLIRPDPSWQWAYGYYGIGTVAETRWNRRDPTDGDRLWTLPLTPVAPPPAALVAPAHTWAEVTDLYRSWADVIAAKRTWLDLIRDPDPGAP